MDLREKEIGKERKKEICLERKREHKILKSNVILMKHPNLLIHICILIDVL